MYKIKWNGEIIDEFDTKQEANKMLSEYNLAFCGGCRIVK